jgi:hypothetical protein
MPLIWTDEDLWSSRPLDGCHFETLSQVVCGQLVMWAHRMDLGQDQQAGAILAVALERAKKVVEQCRKTKDGSTNETDGSTDGNGGDDA